MIASEQIEKFKEFIDSNYQKQLNRAIKKGEKALVISFSDLSKFDHDLAEQLLDDPEETIKAAEISLESFDLPEDLPLKIRFTALPDSQKIKIRNIRSKNLNTLISIEGVIRQSSDVRPQVISAKFECPACGNTITILQIDTKFKEPTRCSCGRRGRFRLLNKDLVDVQRLIIEESPETLIGGEQPKRISVFLKEDLVEPKMEKSTTPGSKINVIGIIKEIPILLRSGVQSIRYDLIIDANHINPIEEAFADIDITEEDEEQIQELAKDPRIYERLINSIAPSIYGHEDIKEALILQLVGGVSKEREDGIKTRGDMHVLLIGDPGAGKSALLTFIAKIAPKGRLVSGKGVSSAGITASVVRDEFLKGWALEAGALVLSSGGCCVIDEMDKIHPEDTAAMHQAMEQQIITISKANIQATLKSETTILAAANPKLGRFDPYKMVAEQINMPPTLINRFDLIFPIKDLPSKEKDTKIASHVLNLQQKPSSLEFEISLNLLRKYIAYAKQKIKPKLTDSAIDEIKTFYVNLRNQGTSTEDALRPIPITARQLEGLVRLAEASAKIRLSKKVTRSDAKRAIKLLKNCLMQVGFDQETGQIDIDRVSTTISASQRGKISLLRDIIEQLESRIGKTIPLEDVIAEAEEKGITEDKVEEIIDRMKREGLVFEPKTGFIQRI